MNPHWKQKNRPASLEARFEFDDFQTLRAFLDELAEEADRLEHHPNVSFGRGHVSVIIYSLQEAVDETDRALAEGIDNGFYRVTKQPLGVSA